MRSPLFFMGSCLTAAQLLSAQVGRVDRPHPIPGGVTDTPRVTPRVGPGGATSRLSSDANPRGAKAPTQRLAETSPILNPWMRERCTIIPTADFWRTHDLATEIRMKARHGFIPMTAFPEDATELKDWTWASCGFRIYGFLVPPGGSVTVALDHPKPAWFRVFWSDRWGAYRPGMQVRIGSPEARYENLGAEVEGVYLVVDDPGQWSMQSDPYTLKVKRSFDPATMDKGKATLVAGIWNTRPPVDASHR